MKAVLNKKLLRAFTGGIIRQKVSQLHVMSSNALILDHIFADLPPIQDCKYPDRQQQLACYAACGAIIEHSRNKKLYNFVMG